MNPRSSDSCLGGIGAFLDELGFGVSRFHTSGVHHGNLVQPSNGCEANVLDISILHGSFVEVSVLGPLSLNRLEEVR